MAYELYYWQGVPGRGEFVRLVLEAAGAGYADNPPEDLDTPTPSFAPPHLRDGDIVVGQTALILFYLGPKLGLTPDDEAGRLWTHQVQLTVTDFVTEAHDSHHPLGPGDYYEHQKKEAKRRAREFRHERIPAFLEWFETILDRNPSGSVHLVGDSLTYADLSLFQMVEGLKYAFPLTMKKTLPGYPLAVALSASIAGLPRIKSYLVSPRRHAFNENGIFRHYPELDKD